MNRDLVEGRWKLLSGKILEQWNALLSDESGVNTARRTQRAGGMQMRRGSSKEESERQFKDFLYRNRDWDISKR